MKERYSDSIKIGLVLGIVLFIAYKLVLFTYSIIDFDALQKKEACENAGYVWIDKKCIDVKEVDVRAIADAYSEAS